MRMTTNERFRSRFLCLSIALFALLAVDCGGPSGKRELKDRARRLEYGTRTYSGALRWGDYPTALSLIRPRPAPSGDEASPKEPKPFEETPVDQERLLADLKDVRLASFRVTDVTFQDGHDLARVRSEITYYLGNSPRLRELVDVQTWWYDAEAKTWYLDGTIPDF